MPGNANHPPPILLSTLRVDGESRGVHHGNTSHDAVLWQRLARSQEPQPGYPRLVPTAWVVVPRRVEQPLAGAGRGETRRAAPMRLRRPNGLEEILECDT
jgi:hypothetical protein